MGIILDTDVIIAGERGTLALENWMASRPDEVFAVATITVAELMHGVERATAAHRAKRQSYIENILSVIRIIPYLDSTARRHAQLWARLEAKGQMIGDYDMLIAATALEHGAAVATFNKKHFAAIPGLKVLEP